MPDPCVHCRRRAATRARGLCSRCYGDTAIRAATPTNRNYTRRPTPWGDREPTMAELEAVIAEQLPTMPRD